jgi:hypothetical protein
VGWPTFRGVAVRATDNDRLGLGVRLKAVDASYLFKPVKVALWTKDMNAKSTDELLKKVRDLSPNYYTEHLTIMVRLSELKGQKFIVVEEHANAHIMGKHWHQN